MHNDILLAGPVQTLLRLIHDAGTSAFWLSIGVTFLHILIGFCISLVLAIVLSFCSWKFRLVEELLAPLVSFMKSVPVVCIIVLLLMWVGSSRVSSIAVGLMTFPPVYFSCLEGFKQEDPAMREMLDVFQVPAARRIRFYYIPLVLPYLVSSLKVVVGISWKSGIAAEVIGIPAGTIGEQVYLSKITLDSARLFAWTFTIVGLSALCEHVTLLVVDRLAHAASDSTGKALQPSHTPTHMTKHHVRTSSDRSARTASGLSARIASDRSAPLASSRSDRTVPRDAEPIILEHVSFAYSESHTPTVAATPSDATPSSAPSTGTPPRDESKAGAKPKEGEQQRLTSEKPTRDHLVLDDVTLHMNAGERLCLMGPSGIGKTTLLRIVLGSLRPSSGSVNLPDCISCSFQEDRLLKQLSAWDNVRLVMPDAQPENLLHVKGELDALLGTDSATLTPAQLSGGMKRKVSLVRALAASSEVMIMDEPFAGLDDTSKRAAVTCIERNLRGRTLIVATHDCGDADLLNAHLYSFCKNLQMTSSTSSFSLSTLK